MQITMSLPSCSSHDREAEIAWYRGIDEGPWDGLAAFERVVYPWSWALTVTRSGGGYDRASPNMVRHSRRRCEFAKEAATIDVLSGGRLTLGVGIGAHDVEYVATAGELKERRQRMDEQVSVMKNIWAQVPPVEGHYAIGPEPVQGGGIPLIAGVEGPKAIARAAKWAKGVMDGSYAMHFDAERIGEQRQRVIKGWTEAGRSDMPHFSASLFFSLGDDPKEQMGEFLADFLRPYDVDAGFLETTTCYGADNLRAAVSGARHVGVDNLILFPTTADPQELLRAREVLGI